MTQVQELHEQVVINAPIPPTDVQVIHALSLSNQPLQTRRQDFLLGGAKIFDYTYYANIYETNYMCSVAQYM